MPTIGPDRVVTVTLKVIVPTRVAHDDAREWLMFNLGKNCGMRVENPLSDYDVEPTDIMIEWPHP